MLPSLPDELESHVTLESFSHQVAKTLGEQDVSMTLNFTTKSLPGAGHLNTDIVLLVD